MRLCVRVVTSQPSGAPTLEVGKLKVVVVQRQVVLHGREAARPGGEVPDALVLAVQDLRVVICNTFWTFST